MNPTNQHASERVTNPPTAGVDGGSLGAAPTTPKRPEPRRPMQQRARRQRYGRVPLPPLTTTDDRRLPWPRRVDEDNLRFISADRPAAISERLG